MRQSVALRTEPTLRQAKVILTRLQRDLTDRGADVELVTHDQLRFRPPLPWRGRSLGWMLAVSSGRAEISAGGGGPWRVRYALHFTALRILCAVGSAALVYFGWGWPRLSLIQALVALWGLVYLPLHLAATAAFARLLRSAARDVVERRSTPRASDAITTGEHPTGGPPSAGPPSSSMG